MGPTPWLPTMTANEPTPETGKKASQTDYTDVQLSTVSESRVETDLSITVETNTVWTGREEKPEVVVRLVNDEVGGQTVTELSMTDQTEIENLINELAAGLGEFRKAASDDATDS
jgi:hypothetical protein